MGTVTLLEKARAGRRNAIASLGTRTDRTDTVMSIFDSAFDEPQVQLPTAAPNVIAFRSSRTTVPAVANDDRIAA